MQTMETTSDTDKVARIATTRTILQQIKSGRMVGTMFSSLQLADRMQQKEYVSGLCDAGLIRHFGDAQYSITLKGLRFLDAVEMFEQATEKASSSSTNLVTDMAS